MGTELDGLQSIGDKDIGFFGYQIECLSDSLLQLASI